MAGSLQFAWKEFKVEVGKVNDRFRSMLSSDYDGMLCTPDEVTLVFKVGPSQADSDAATAFWTALAVDTFSPTPEQQMTAAVYSAMQFGQQVIAEFSATNALNNLSVEDTATLAGQLAPIQLLLLSGSLYTALNAIENIPPSDLLPAEIIAAFSLKIREYLGITG